MSLIYRFQISDGLPDIYTCSLLVATVVVCYKLYSFRVVALLFIYSLHTGSKSNNKDVVLRFWFASYVHYIYVSMMSHRSTLHYRVMGEDIVFRSHGH